MLYFDCNIEPGKSAHGITLESESREKEREKIQQGENGKRNNEWAQFLVGSRGL